MRFYLLTRLKNTDFDRLVGCLVRAKDAAQARQLAAEAEPDSNAREDWLSVTTTDCKWVNPRGSAEVLISDVNWG